MRVLAFIFINLFIFWSWILCIVVLRRSAKAENIVYAGLLMAAQIVLLELLLGTVGALKLPVLLLTNISISSGLLAWLVIFRRAMLAAHLSGMNRQFSSAFQGVLTPVNVSLIVLGIFLTTWFCVAAYFLPPRGIDDLVGHLPPIYQYVQTHEISLLPLLLRDTFAMPQNGEFLFLWPLIFFHEDTFIDLVQYVVAVYGVFVIFALARRFDVERTDAAFVGLLFLFTPLVLGQSGSNYIDLIVGVCNLTLLYAVVRFWQTGAVFHLIMAGIATGFGLGLKYNMLVAVVAVQPMILLRLLRDTRLNVVIRNYTYYIVFSLPLCVYWYARNFLKTGYPLYPYQLDIDGLHVAPGTALSTNFPGKPRNAEAAPGSALTDFLHDPVGFFLSYMFQDPGLGSFHGGFGVVFWGLGLPAIAYCIFLAVRAAIRRDFFHVLFWGQVPLVFFVYLLQISSSRLQYNQRLILVVIGFGLLAFGIVLKKLRAEFPLSVPVIRSFCVAAAVLSVIHVAGYGWPTFQLKQAVTDLTSGTRTSEYKYFAQSPWDLPLLRIAWEPLDYLTRSGDGWNVYAAATWNVYWTTPVFGSRIQNRVWNFQLEPENFPDAFIFHHKNDSHLNYIGKKITPEQVWSDGRFEIVTQTPATQFWVRSRLLREPETRRKLIEYYERTFEPNIIALESIAGDLPAGGVLITASSWGHSLKYLSLSGTLRRPVHIVPEGKVGSAARRLKAKNVITIGETLRGYESAPIARLTRMGNPVIFYENRLR